MVREFVRTHTFDRNWEACGLNDEDLRRLEQILSDDPNAGVVIPHLDGGRKLRFALEGRGKSGGARVIYIDVVIQERIYLLLAYSKGSQTDLTSKQKKVLCDLIVTLKEE